MSNSATNQEASGERNNGHRKRKKIRVRVKMDDGRKKKQRRQNITMILIIAFILGLLVAAYMLYKMDQSSAPPQIEAAPPAG